MSRLWQMVLLERCLQRAVTLVTLDDLKRLRYRPTALRRASPQLLETLREGRRLANAVNSV
ncbi:MAG: hypothetical protein V7L29_11920 [Nostoc sp.]|uniref:hypothetical protein n=1 Tax=Nostoc sp. TaxID=1180 RepID=UPI002FF2F294